MQSQHKANPVSDLCQIGGQETREGLTAVAVSPYAVKMRETGLEPARYYYH